VHAFEFSDLEWFPRVLRDLLTDSLQFGITRFGFYNRAAPLVERLLARADADSVIDLCSGATGPWLTLRERIARPFRLTCTDKHPGRRGGALGLAASYDPRSIDATSIPDDLWGVRTMFTGFHHFRPEHARAILATAARRGEAIGIFEFTERSLVSCAVAIVVPFAMLLTTAFMRPITWQRLLFTYVLPIVPLCNLWDGVISSLRTYSPGDLAALVEGLQVDGYIWEIDQLPSEGTAPPITYLLGYPERS
jgi:hypothetical protein